MTITPRGPEDDHFHPATGDAPAGTDSDARPGTRTGRTGCESPHKLHSGEEAALGCQGPEAKESKRPPERNEQQSTWLRRLSERLGYAILGLVCTFLEREIEESRRRWRRGLRSEQAWLLVLVTAVSLYVLWQWAFSQGIVFGLSFLTLATLTILRACLQSF